MTELPTHCWCGAPLHGSLTRHDPDCEVAVLQRTVLPYSLGSRLGMDCITCSTCQKTSFNRTDINERYCGFCHKFL